MTCAKCEKPRKLSTDSKGTSSTSDKSDWICIQCFDCKKKKNDQNNYRRSLEEQMEQKARQKSYLPPVTTGLLIGREMTDDPKAMQQEAENLKKTIMNDLKKQIETRHSALDELRRLEKYGTNIDILAGSTSVYNRAKDLEEKKRFRASLDKQVTEYKENRQKEKDLIRFSTCGYNFEGMNEKKTPAEIIQEKKDYNKYLSQQVEEKKARERAARQGYGSSITSLDTHNVYDPHAIRCNAKKLEREWLAEMAKKEKDGNNRLNGQLTKERECMDQRVREYLAEKQEEQKRKLAGQKHAKAVFDDQIKLVQQRKKKNYEFYNSIPKSECLSCHQVKPNDMLRWCSPQEIKDYQKW